MFGCAKMKSERLRKADGILIAAVLAAACLAALFFDARGGDEPALAVIEQDGRELMRLPLVGERDIRIEGEGGGYNLVEIGPEGVRVAQADCPDLRSSGDHPPCGREHHLPAAQAGDPPGRRGGQRAGRCDGIDE